MSRDDGFARADVDTSYMDDDKLRRLWRIVEPDTATMCECVVLHQATLLASWREGRRLTVEESAPLWFPGAPTALVAPLVKAGLLDGSHRIPIKAFRCWIGPAVERRNVRSEAGRKGGISSARSRVEQTSSKRQRLLNPTNQPTNQPTNARGRAGARGAAQPARVADLLPAIPGEAKRALAAHGYDPDGIVGGKAS